MIIAHNRIFFKRSDGALFLCKGGEQVNDIKDSPAYKYATFAAAEGNPKIPKYVRRQAQAWLVIADGKSPDAYVDADMLRKISQLMRLMVHPDLNCPISDGLEPYAHLFITALFCTKARDGRRYYTTGILEIARKIARLCNAKGYAESLFCRVSRSYSALG